MLSSRRPKAAKLQPQIAAAMADLANAEGDLRVTLERLPLTVRAEKQIISATLQAALEKVSAARKRLEGVLEVST